MQVKNYCMPPEDVYGKAWMERNKEELEKWEWEFRIPAKGDYYVAYGPRAVEVLQSSGEYFTSPRLIRIREKDPIRDCYGKSFGELTAPEGFEFTGEFREPKQGEYALTSDYRKAVEVFPTTSWLGPHANRLILRKKRPAYPTLQAIYGVDKVTLPSGYEWTGEFRDPQPGDCALGRAQCLVSAEKGANLAASYWKNNPRLILRAHNRKTVWFKAEEKPRLPKKGEYFNAGTGDGWQLAPADFMILPCICATRHEEPDETRQVVTEEDVRKAFEAKEAQCS